MIFCEIRIHKFNILERKEVELATPLHLNYEHAADTAMPPTPAINAPAQPTGPINAIATPMAPSPKTPPATK